TSLRKRSMTVATTPLPTAKKRHLPAVGIIGLVLIATAVVAVGYTQFLHPPPTLCTTVPEHRLYVMEAIIKERGGFMVQGIYKLNSTAIPFSNATGPKIASPNATQIPALPDSSQIYGSVGDTVTLYIHPVSTNETGPSPPAQQQQNLLGHGFDFDSLGFISITNSTVPASHIIAFGAWYTLSFHVNGEGTTKYRCTQTCSQLHPQMNGNLQAGCGG
ncbi:MAG TPA: hypothetical protein VE177_04230, partial [Candidatus Binatus sp.]|nr:hypothetical protein [Candidatus Binatus sp.]